MADWLNAQLTQLGVTTQLVDLGRHTMDGEDLPLPPAILGRIGNDKEKKTVLIYGHFDVQPVCRVRSRLSTLMTVHRLTNRMDGTPSLSH